MAGSWNKVRVRFDDCLERVVTQPREKVDSKGKRLRLNHPQQVGRVKEEQNERERGLAFMQPEPP